MIVNIRGTSGAGKTTIIRELMEKYKHEDVYGGIKVQAVLIHWAQPIYVIGRYDNVCGGCDTIKTQDETRQRITKYCKLGHVLYEGLTISNGYAKNLKHHRRMKQPFAFAFLDTPLVTCLSRVRKRRKAAGNTKPFNTENTEKLFFANLRFLQRAVYDDANPVVLNHKNPTKELITLLWENRL
jgi:thymidylate kinase